MPQDLRCIALKTVCLFSHLIFRSYTVNIDRSLTMSAERVRYSPGQISRVTAIFLELTLGCSAAQPALSALYVSVNPVWSCISSLLPSLG